jgi:hypothetical protein
MGNLAGCVDHAIGVLYKKENKKRQVGASIVKLVKNCGSVCVTFCLL